MEDELAKLFARLATVADQLNELEASPNATVHYELFADALWWSDEQPDFKSAEDHWCLRPVLRYRTTLILESPEEHLSVWWQAAQEHFPRWPGFAPERCKPLDHLKTFYYRRRVEGLLSIVLLDIACRVKNDLDEEFNCDALTKSAFKRDPPDITAGRIHRIVCASLRSSGKPAPEETWGLVQRCIAEGLGIPVEDVQPESWIVGTLRGDWNRQ